MFSYISDKTQKRRFLTSVPPLLYGLALAVTMMLKGNALISFIIFCLASFFLQTNQSSFWTLPSLILKPEIVGGSRGFISAIGALSGFFGPYIMGYFMDLTGSMDYAVNCLFIFPVVGWIVVQSLPKHLNARKIINISTDFSSDEQADNTIHQEIIN
jgi:nitrate/nitrite transporter NarK